MSRHQRSQEHLIKYGRIRSKRRYRWQKPLETEEVDEQQISDIDLEEIELGEYNAEETSRDYKNEKVTSDTILDMAVNVDRLQRSRDHIQKSRQAHREAKLKSQSETFRCDCIPNINKEPIEEILEVELPGSSKTSDQEQDKEISFIDTPSTSRIPDKTTGTLPRIFQALLNLWRKPPKNRKTYKEAEP